MTKQNQKLKCDLAKFNKAIDRRTEMIQHIDLLLLEFEAREISVEKVLSILQAYPRIPVIKNYLKELGKSEREFKKMKKALKKDVIVLRQRIKTAYGKFENPTE